MSHLGQRTPEEVDDSLGWTWGTITPHSGLSREGRSAGAVEGRCAQDIGRGQTPEEACVGGSCGLGSTQTSRRGVAGLFAYWTDTGKGPGVQPWRVTRDPAEN